MQPLWKTVWSFLKKLTIDLLYNPAVPLLDICLKEMEALTFKDTCTPIYVHKNTVYSSQKIWKHPKCPPVMDQEDVVYVHIIEYYSAMKKSEILTFAATWMDLEGIVQILNKTEKDSYI